MFYLLPKSKEEDEDAHRKEVTDSHSSCSSTAKKRR